MQLNSHLHFNGECESAFKFYEKCLGGKITFMMPHEGINELVNNRKLRKELRDE